MHKADSAQDFFDKLTDFKEECLMLRELLLSKDLEETLKWGAPIYTLHGKNLIGLGVFKSYCGLWFFQGVHLKDSLKVLVSGSEKTHTQRQWRFHSLKEIKPKSVLRYITEAIQNEELGIKTKIVSKPLDIHPFLEAALNKNKSFLKSWELLSLTFKREYTDYINEAKKDETKIQRIEKN